MPSFVTGVGRLCRIFKNASLPEIMRFRPNQRMFFQPLDFLRFDVNDVVDVLQAAFNDQKRLLRDFFG
jgi:hypothetical protein